MPVIDAHQHFWRYSADAFPWIGRDGVLARDFGLDDLAPLLAANAVDSCIAVQATHTAEETDWLLALAAANDQIAGVIGWVDLESPDLSDRLDALAETRLVGVRHLVQDEPDPDWILRPSVLRGVRAILDRGLAFDILVRAPQLDRVATFLDGVGPGKLVLDHAGKPSIADGAWEPWAEVISEIAARPQVVCKLSGLVTEADPERWTASDIRPYLDHLLACFGPERLMAGSDWPVCLLASTYDRTWSLVTDFAAAACPASRDAILGGTAQRLYLNRTRASA